MDPILSSKTAEAPDPSYVDDGLALLKGWVNYGIGEKGQKAKSDNDKVVAQSILHVCEDDNEAAIKAAEHRNKSLLQRIF